MKKRRDTKLSLWLKQILGKAAPIEFQIINDLAEGDPGRTNAEVVAEKVVEAAREGKQWAIELCYDRTEGKPAQSAKADVDDTRVEERINDVTKQHLTILAEKLGAPISAHTVPVAEESDDGRRDHPGQRAAGPARSILDLPKDEAGDSQDAGGES